MSKVCSKCGCVVEDNAKFCDECGAPLNSGEPAVAVQEAPPINMYANNNIANGGGFGSPMINMYEQSVSGQQNVAIVTVGNRVLGIIALVCGIISIITIGCWFFPELVAIICGILSKNSAGKRTGLGKAGLICGVIGCILLVLIIMIVILA